MPVSYTMIDNAGGRFSLDGSTIKVASGLTAGEYEITIRAQDGNGWSKDFVLDITVEGETVITLPPLPLHSRIVFGGDSNYQGTFGASIAGFAFRSPAAMAIPVRFANQAVAGWTSANVLANVNAIITLTGDICSLNVGRNDLYNITNETDRASIVASVKANLLSIWSILLDGDNTYKRVVHNTLLPRPVGQGSYTQLMEDARLEINTWLRAQDHSFGGRLRIADMGLANVDIDQDFMADIQHVNYRGAYKCGKVAGSVISAVMGDVPAYYTDPTDFASILSPTSRLLAGSGGSAVAPATGSVATGCVLRVIADNTAGITVTASKEVDDNGYNVQRIDVSAEPGAASFEVRFFVGTDAGSWGAGSRQFGKMRCRISDAQNLRLFSGGLYRNNSVSTETGTLFGELYTFPGAAGIGGIPSDDVGLSAGVVNLPSAATRLWVLGRLFFEAGGGGGTFRLSRPTLFTGIAYP